MGKIAKYCIKHKVTTLLAFIMIAIFGIVYSQQLQMSLLPNMEYPAAIVYSYYNGASPADMEELVTRPLESAIMSVPGVKSVSSSSAESITTIAVEYENDTDLDIAASKLREKFSALSLPDGCSTPVIMNINISEMMPTAIVALLGDDLTATQSLAEDIVAPALERIDGVASVSVSGGVSQQVAIEIDSARAQGYGLSNSYISQILTAENLLFPGGSVENGKQSYTVSTNAKLQSVEDIANVIIPLPTGGTVRLNEIANVELELKDRNNIAELNGTSGVVLQVSKASSANEEATANRVEETMAKLSAQNPSVKYDCVYLASDFIDIAVKSALENIALGVLIAAIIVFIFLGKFGATFAIIVSMPVCILTVFVLMYVCDITMNMMSLGGIAMGVGMIVDNSIVVLENIYRYRAEGNDRFTSCVDGTKEVFISLTASTLTTVAVFLPLGLTDGIAGMVFKDFCLTIVFLILSSLIIAVTLVPLLTYFLLDDKHGNNYDLKKLSEKGLGLKVFNGYKKLLKFFVTHLKTGMLISILLIGGFVAGCVATPMALLPDMDMGEIQVMVSMPIGSKAKDTAAISEQICDIIVANVPELEKVYYIAEDESSSVSFSLVSKTKRDRSSVDVANDLRTKLKDVAGCEIVVTASDITALMTGNDIDVQITGTDYDTLIMISEELMDKIRELPDAVDISSSASEKTPQVSVTINREAASQYGLTAASIGSAIRSELSGSTATTVTINSREIDVVVRGDNYSSTSLDALKSMSVPSNYGGSVPLSSVADVEVILAPQTISRVNQSRRISITGSTISGSASSITKDIQSIVDGYDLPDGYSVHMGGEYEDIMDNFKDLGLALLVAVGLVYFVLASQFESFVLPVMVMMILPLAFSGALIALPLTGNKLTMIALVALIILAGTVVNASIILVDYIKQRRDAGEDRTTAILNACPLRVRPVLMTTLTTILALVPMALGLGETNEMLSSMGITMVSGMTISTVITLLFTPVYYCVIDNIGKKKR